ncbi:hypothetical protein [Nonomuraea insulae]|uniref:Uncharacterized protein n=1 Tax=Nonomuraea insulae TaxID=1616787 RepID=A0ABW1C9N7_9ACTN
MRNGVRHLLGAGAGLLATPLIAAGFLYSSNLAERWIALVVLGASMVVVGVLAGSRISPLASLVPGLAFAGAAAFARSPWIVLIQAEYTKTYLDLIDIWGLTTACVLLAASVFPSRWRGVRKPEPSQEEVAEEEPPPLPKRIPSRY